MLKELFLAATLSSSPVNVYASEYIQFNDLVAVINISEYYQVDLPFQGDDIDFYQHIGADVAYIVFTAGYNTSDRPVPGTPTISDLNGLILDTTYGGITDYETGDFYTINTNANVYVLVKDSIAFESAIDEIRDYNEDFGIGRGLIKVTVENVVNDYQNFLTNRIEVSALEQYYYNIGYTNGFNEGYISGSQVANYEWLDIFNNIFTREIFPGFKIYYLLLFALGLIVLRGVAKAVL